MLQRLTETPGEVLALDALGVVTKHDYQAAFEPAVEQAHREGTRLRLLYRCGPKFRALTPGALWADARLGARYLRVLDGCAVVTDKGWIRESTRGIGAWMPIPVRVFPTGEQDQAVAWLASLREPANVSRRAMAAAYVGGVLGAIGSLVSWPARGRR
ncbi:MAG: STAS/SEC14 domain-containing protein [Pseudonocardia sp.]|nr:STAS/SEC14 domain-containing protein [Pseudonocardia sp.]